MGSTLTVTPAAEITARLDRLPMTRHMWMLVLLISLGGWFDTYAIFLTGSIAPGMFADKIFTPTTVSLFGFTGLASFIAALFTGLFIGTMFFTQAADRFGRRTVFTYSLVWYCVATLVMAFQYTPGGVNLWRMIAGIGIGVELVTVDTFISELVPKRARGKTFAVQQSIGFIPVPLVALLAWLLNPTAPLGLSGWRWVVIIGSVGAIIVWFVRLRLPESPRWLAQQGRLEEADRVMAAIEARVAEQSGGTLPAPEPPVVEDPRKGSLAEIFNPTYRSRTIDAVGGEFLPDDRFLRVRQLGADVTDRQGHPCLADAGILVHHRVRLSVIPFSLILRIARQQVACRHRIAGSEAAADAKSSWIIRHLRHDEAWLVVLGAN